MSVRRDIWLIIWYCVLCAGSTLAEPPVVKFGDTTEAIEQSILGVKDKQTATDESQRTIENQLEFIAHSVADVIELQIIARQAQQAANEAQGEVERCLGQIENLAVEIERHRPKLRETEASIRKTQSELPAAIEQLTQAEKDLAAGQGAAQKATDAYEADPNKDNRRELTMTKSRAVKLARNRDSARKKVGQLQKFLASGLARAESSHQRCSQWWQEMRRLKDEELATALAAATAAQEKAHIAQRQAYLELQRLNQKNADVNQPADDQTATVEYSQSLLSSLNYMTPVQLVQEARKAEDEITDSYRQGRAAELAMIRGIPKAMAIESIDVHVPSREPLDMSKLTNAAGTTEQMEDYKGELRKAVNQMDSMTARAYELLASARGEGSQITLASVSSAVGTGQALEGAAVQDAGDPAKDLTGLMNAAYGGGGPAGGGGPGGSGGYSIWPHTNPLEGAGGGGFSININPFDESVPGARMGGSRFNPGEHEDVVGMFEAIPGRRVQRGLTGAAWMYVDSWYLIGPFPNPQRRSIERRFAPESVVDLDAVYEGHGGLPVRWKFVQTGHPVVRFVGSYSIYYAYTELWFDEPMELWIALGSDDGSRLYINDLLVWRTVELKAWQINEAYRKVSFKKGRNRILYRVENGPAHGWFSFILHVQPNRRTADGP